MRQSRVIDSIFEDAIFQLEKEWKNHAYGDELFRNENTSVTSDKIINNKGAAQDELNSSLVEEEEDLSALLAECREEFRPSEESEVEEGEDLSALLAECREEFRPSEESEVEEGEDLSALLAECRDEFRPSEESEVEEEEDLSALLAECRDEFRPSEESEVEEEEDLSALLAECREEFRPSEESEVEEGEDLSALLAECREEFRPSEESEVEEGEDLSALLAECREEFRPSEESEVEEGEDLSALLAECREEFRPSEESEVEEEEDLSALLAECREEFRPSEESEVEEEEDLSALLAECRDEFRPSEESEVEEEEDLSALLAECRDEFRPSEESEVEEEEDLSALLAECCDEFRPSEESEVEEEEDLSALLAECREEFRPSDESGDVCEEDVVNYDIGEDVVESDLSSFLDQNDDVEYNEASGLTESAESILDEVFLNDNYIVDDFEDKISIGSSETTISINVDGINSDSTDGWIRNSSNWSEGSSEWLIDSSSDVNDKNIDVCVEPEDYVVTNNIDDDELDFENAPSDFDSDEDLDSLLDDLTSGSSFSGLGEQEEEDLDNALNEAISSLKENDDSLDHDSIGNLMESAFDIDSEFDVEEEEAAAADVTEPNLNAFEFGDISTLHELDDAGLDDDDVAEEKSKEFFEELDSEIDSIIAEDDEDNFVVGVQTVPVPEPSIQLIEDIEDEDVDKMLVDMGFGSDGLLHNKFGPNKEKLLSHLINRFEYLARRKLDTFPETQAELVKSINLRIEIDLKFGEYSTDGEDDSLFNLDV